MWFVIDIYGHIYIIYIFYWNVKNKYNRIVRTDLSLNLRFHHGGRGLDGDRWWAGLEHYTPGLKMDPTPALHSNVLTELVCLELLRAGPLKVIAHRVRNFRTLKIKYDLTLCQSRLHTASETLVRQKKIRIRFDFLRFRIRNMHFGRKGWGIRKKRTRKFRTQCAMTFSVVPNSAPLPDYASPPWN